MRIIAALGGNALLQRGEAPLVDVQEHHVRSAAGALAEVARAHQLVITHGNGPQVGILAQESAADAYLPRPYPLDVLVAETQGMIGYWLLQSLENVLPGRLVAAVITRTLVSADDPEFTNPTKFVGPVYDQAQAVSHADHSGWVVKPDGRYWRRVVPSPPPQRIVDAPLLRSLVGMGALVICAGGGGVPVVRNCEGQLEGVEAVVDKDATAALLAETLDADVLLLLTDVPGVFRGFGTPEGLQIRATTPGFLRSLTFPEGSMGPKVRAACRFVDSTGGTAAIGALSDIEGIVAGTAGTIVKPA